MRYLLLALLVVYVVWRWRARSLAGSRSGRTAAAAEPAAPGVIERVECAHCGVHVPVTQALLARGRYFCSRVHQDAAGA